MGMMNLENLKDWIGREEENLDVAAVPPLLALAATLDYADPPWRSGEVPPLGHWLYFLPKAMQGMLDRDGHPHRGGFLPPVPLPRRMFAGGRLEFLAPIRQGEALRRRSTILSVEPKTGRSGPMLFVTVAHDVFVQDGPALRELQNIVYREAAAPGAAPSTDPADPAPSAVWERTVDADPMLLFRFSALTFNGHRIHYDRQYAEVVEGYPGLVVHGPLIATLLMDLFLRHNPGARISTFQFRAQRPLFDVQPFTLCGTPTPDGASLWALDPAGRIAMQAELEAA
ncbi:acyl-CoA dehydrogenase [Azospirillum sp. TSH64]|nr:acyl-CoA dehydrogenase [Azospirillum sp. TSH64]